MLYFPKLKLAMKFYTILILNNYNQLSLFFANKQLPEQDPYNSFFQKYLSQPGDIKIGYPGYRQPRIRHTILFSFYEYRFLHRKPIETHADR